MLHSAEVRWFKRGSLPLEAVGWFRAGRPLSAEERTDRYLVFPGCETVGVKVRQESLEIKALRGSSEVVHFPCGVAGRAECWVKWSSDQPGVQAWLQALLREAPPDGRGQAGWTAVAKTRWLRTFSLDGRLVAEVTFGQRVSEGCRVELTRILAAGGEWWSVGLETFGDPARMHDSLRLGGSHFFAHHPPLEVLEVAGSCSYPAWLAGL